MPWRGHIVSPPSGPIARRGRARRSDELGAADDVVAPPGELQRRQQDVVRQRRQPRHGDVRQGVRPIPLLLGARRRSLGQSVVSRSLPEPHTMHQWRN